MGREFDKTLSELNDKVQGVDQGQLKFYMDMLDRFLLYNLVAMNLPKEAVCRIIESWTRSVKQSIDVETRMRTDFLESTQEGRAAKFKQVPDGEAFRLDSLKTLKVARELAEQQLVKHRPDQLED
jgi:hypothetical protein